MVESTIAKRGTRRLDESDVATAMKHFFQLEDEGLSPEALRGFAVRLETMGGPAFRRKVEQHIAMAVALSDILRNLNQRAD